MTIETAMYILVMAAKFWLFLDANNTVTILFLRRWSDGSPKGFIKYFGASLIISWVMIFFLF